MILWKERAKVLYYWISSSIAPATLSPAGAFFCPNPTLMSKDTYYFSHDYNARTNPKVKKLMLKHGMAGYGVFWSIVEDLYNNANALPLDYDCIAYDLRVDELMVKSIINDFDLFVISGHIFGSRSIENRLSKRDEKSAKARESAQKRWSKKPEDDANALPPQSEGNAIKDSIGKDSIENEKKEDITVITNECEVVKLSREECLSVFDSFRKEYPGTKRGNETEFENFKKKHKDWGAVLPTLRDRLVKIKSYREVLKRSNKFVPQWQNLQTFINQRTWEMEVPEDTPHLTPQPETTGLSEREHWLRIQAEQNAAKQH